MGRYAVVLSTILLLCVAYSARQYLRQVPPLPNINDDVWWGAEGRLNSGTADETIRPFTIHVSKEVILDLNSSLDWFLKRRQTPPLENQGFQYGFNSDYLKEIITYWRHKYNWKARETYLNQYPQFQTSIQGLDIHFIRVTSKPAGRKKVLPLLLLHGWPGSVREFYELIPLLTTPRDSADFVFEVIVPSLPGYGFSQGAAKPGLGAAQIAAVLKNLMERLGHQQFYIQGGDLGSVVGRIMAVLYPQKVLGLHSNLCSVRTLRSNILWALGSVLPSLVVDKPFQPYMYPLADKLAFLLEETGYFHIQATKPDTIGTVLHETPAGLAAYLLEKFSTGTNPAYKQLQDGGLTRRYSLESLLDNVMIYWITNSSTTAMRLYAETFNKAHSSLRLDSVPVTVPTACARFPHELTWQPEVILREIFVNLVHLTDHEQGGHFAAFEVPQLLSEDIWSAVSKFEAVQQD